MAEKENLEREKRATIQSLALRASLCISPTMGPPTLMTTNEKDEWGREILAGSFGVDTSSIKKNKEVLHVVVYIVDQLSIVGRGTRLQLAVASTINLAMRMQTSPSNLLHDIYKCHYLKIAIYVSIRIVQIIFFMNHDVHLEEQHIQSPHKQALHI